MVSRFSRSLLTVRSQLRRSLLRVPQQRPFAVQGLPFGGAPFNVHRLLSLSFRVLWRCATRASWFVAADRSSFVVRRCRSVELPGSSHCRQQPRCSPFAFTLRVHPSRPHPWSFALHIAATLEIATSRLVVPPSRPRRASFVATSLLPRWLLFRILWATIAVSLHFASSSPFSFVLLRVQGFNLFNFCRLVFTLFFTF